MKITLLLRPYQELATNSMLSHDRCLLVAPTGSGKTLIIGSLIERRPEPTLIIVTTSQLRLQMKDMLKGLDVPEPILLSAKKPQAGYLYISTWQTLKNMDVLPQVNMIVSDEAHHISELTLYGQIIGTIHPKYHYAATATPQRYDGIKELLKLCDGHCHTIDIETLYKDGYLIRPAINFVDTGCTFDTREALSAWEFQVFSDEQKLGRMKAIIGTDQARNARIANCIIDIAASDRHQHILVLSYTIAQCQELYDRTGTFTRDKFLIHGQESKAAKKLYFEHMQESIKSITFATQSYLGEGIDIPKLDTMVIATPFGGGPKTVQFAGRILRPAPGKTAVCIYDFYDEMVGIGEYWSSARRRQYNKLRPMIR